MEEKRWKISMAQKRILDSLFQVIDPSKINRVLDVGSGRTSIHYLANKFKHVKIKGIVYIGDERKIKPIKECVPEDNYELIETDIKDFDFNQEFDIVLAHLFLGEAKKFGNNKFNDVLNLLFFIKTKYLAIIDILTDKDIDYRLLLKFIAQKSKLVNLVYEVSEEGKECIGFLCQS